MSTQTDQLDETALVLFPDALGHPFRQTGTLQAGPYLYGGRGGVSKLNPNHTVNIGYLSRKESVVR